MSRQIIQDALNEIRDEYITEAGVKLGLLTIGAAAVSAAGTAVNPADLYTVPGGASAGTATKAGFGAWLAKGGWVALVAGAVAAAGIAVGAFFLAGRGDTPPAGDHGSVGDTASGEDATEACDHAFTDWKEDKAPTCNESGKQSRTCTLCSLTETDTVIPLPHTFVNDVCSVCGATASKLAFTSNGDGTCYVSGWGDEKTGSEAPLVIPTYAPNGERVISISAKAFNGGENHRDPPEEILVSEGIEIIGDNAFEGCGWLRSITLPSTLVSIGNNAFTNSGLRSLTLSQGVRSIGNGAFSQTFLTSVTIPASVTEIGNGAFAYITDLREARFAEGSTLTALPASIFWQTPLTEITLPDSVTAIGENAFENCGSLTAVHAKNVTEIGASAFAGCHSLTALPASLKIDGIGANALMGCTALATTEHDGGCYMALEGNPYAVLICGGADVTSASLHPDARLVMGSAFEGNTALTAFTFPDTAAEIPDRFFYGCTALTSVNMPAALTRVGSETFFGCSALPNVTLPEGVLTVGASAFSGCTSFTEIILPDSITEIRAMAFADCKNLTSVKLPASLTAISSGLFMNCMELTGTLVIPDGVTAIQSNPFARCVELLTVVMPKSVVRFEGQIFTAGVQGVQYAGTMAEWEAIEKDKDWYAGRHAYLNVVICTDGQIELN